MEERRKRKLSSSSNHRNHDSCDENCSELSDSVDLLPSTEETQENKIKQPKEYRAKRKSLQHGYHKEQSSVSSSHKDDITPAIVASPATAPGAPRILLVSQQANAEPQQVARLPVIDYSQFLRTPPSVKNDRLYIRGLSEDEAYRGYDRFDRISDEIILKIFHHLPRHHMCRCALVCRRWARIVCDKSLWRRIDMGNRLVKEGVLKIILERGAIVLRLSQAEIKGNFTSTVLGAPDPCRSPLTENRMCRVQYLDLSMASVNAKLLESVFRYSPQLRKLSLENVPVTEQLLTNLGLNCPYLNTLNLCMSEGVTAKGLESICQNCPLEELNIGWTVLSREEICEVLSNLPTELGRLNLSGCRDRLKDEDIDILVANAPLLDDLDLSDATDITGQSVQTISSNLCRLRHISLSRCYSVAPQSLMALNELEELESICVYGMMRESAIGVLQHFMDRYEINKRIFSTIARPTPSNSRKLFIWDMPTQQ